MKYILLLVPLLPFLISLAAIYVKEAEGEMVMGEDLKWSWRYANSSEEGGFLKAENKEEGSSANFLHQKCLSEVYCSEEDCQHLDCDAISNCKEEDCPRHTYTLVFKMVDESEGSIYDGALTVSVGAQIQIGNATWLWIYPNHSVENSQYDWFPERVVIESDYKPIVREHSGGWIIIFVKEDDE